MDTVEEMNNTYFYAGRSDLTASQLLFIIFCENTANQLDVNDFGALVSIVAGLKFYLHEQSLVMRLRVLH